MHPQSQGPLVCIVMATYNPQGEFLRKQIDSIKAQSYPNWLCVITDDGSEKSKYDYLKKLVASDERFTLRQNAGRIGVYHNFEAGLYEVPADAELICFCDQDDVWLRDKLEREVDEFSDPSVVLVHSDLSVIDDEDNLLHPSCWKLEKRNTRAYGHNLLLLRNTVTGCTAMFRRELLTLALPFPIQGVKPTFHHDLWIALIAVSAGRVRAIHEPLVLYRQHSQNVLGPEPRSVKRFARKFVRGLPKIANRQFIGCWTDAAVNEWMLRRELGANALARVSKGRESGLRLKRPLVNAVTPFPDFGFLAAGLLSYSVLRGFNSFEMGVKLTAGKFQRDMRVSKMMLKMGYGLAARLGRALSDKAGGKLHQMGLTEQVRSSYSFRDEKSMVPLRLAIDSSVSNERTYNILLPGLEIFQIFGGIATAIKLGIEIAKSGRRVRFITTDGNFPGFSGDRSEKDGFEAFMNRSFPGFAECRERITFVTAKERDSGSVSVGKKDVFVATAWWTALLVDEAIRSLDMTEKKFVYLIQDYEPCFYPWSQDFALAEYSYKLDYVPVFNTHFLEDFFTNNKLTTGEKGFTLKPEVDLGKFFAPPIERMRREGKKRVLIYGRPTIHRNLFGCLVCGLEEWIVRNGFSPEELEIISAGESHPTIVCANGVEIKSVGKVDLSAYPNFLRGFDIGVSLMLSPHPSYPPLEMAASGVVTVTNRYANKDLERISDNFVSCDPHPNSIADALDRALEKVPAYEKRIAGSRLEFPNSLPLSEAVRGLLQRFEIPPRPRKKSARDTTKEGQTALL